MNARVLAGSVLAVLGLALGVWWLESNSLGSDLRAGQAAVDAGRPDLAEAAFRRALTRDPDNEQAMYGIGWAWHMAGQEDQAREAFKLLQEVHPESPLGYKGIGSVWMAQGNVKEAKVAFERALKAAGPVPAAGQGGCGGESPGSDPSAIENSLALLALSQRDGAAALASYEALLQREPERAEFLQGRAEALLLLGRDDDALAASVEAVQRSAGLSGAGGTRVMAMALLTHARALIAVSGGRVDTTRCSETATPVYAWLDEADRDLDKAEALGMSVPSIQGVRRTVLDRRARVDDDCPGQRAVAMPPRDK